MVQRTKYLQNGKEGLDIGAAHRKINTYYAMPLKKHKA